MKKILFSRVIAGICVILFISGCTSLPTASRGTEGGEAARIEKPLSVALTLRFEDVPVPAGFGLLRDQSFIFQDGSTRVGLLRYSGRANASQVIAFFKTQMSLYNWELQNIVEYGNITLNFLKSGENCVVTIEPLATKSIISIIISPKTGTINTGFGPKKEF